MSNSIEFCDTPKQNKALIYDSKIHRLHQTYANGHQRWACVKEKTQSCRGGLLLNPMNDIVKFVEHNCVTNSAEGEVYKQISKCRKRAREDLSTSTANIIREEIVPLRNKGYQFVAALQDHSTSMRNLNRIRQSVTELSREARTARELILPQNVKSTQDGSDTLCEYDPPLTTVNRLSKRKRPDPGATMEYFESGSNNVSTLLPEKSSKLYEKQYELFTTWNWNKYRDENNYSEEAFLSYFTEKSKVVKAPTLWSIYSMLKATIMIKHNVDISKFSNVLMYLKQKNAGYKPISTCVFTSDDLIKFLIEAPDSNYLMIKVCFIFGVLGACRMEELKKLTINDVEDKDTVLIVSIIDSISGKRRRFTITNDMVENVQPIEIYRKYRSLRPSNITHKSLFVYYRSGKCSTQPIGIHAFGKMPNVIATCLKLRNANSFTGHAFRRTSISVFADSGHSCAPIIRKRRAWCKKSATVAPEESSNSDINENAPTTSSSYFLPQIKNSQLYNNHCRTCMGFLATPRNLRSGSYNNLLQMLHRVLGFEIISGEDFNICEGCEGRLKSILEFKSICLKTFEYFSQCELIKPKEEPIDTITIDGSMFDSSMFDFEIKNSHLKNRSLDIEIEEINSKHLENSLSIDSNSSNSSKYEPTVTNLDFDQNIKRTANIKSISPKRNTPLRQFTETDVLEEISRCENMPDNRDHKNCRLCDYIGKNFAELGSHMARRHRSLSRWWCNQCNLLTDNLQKHRDKSKCSDFCCKFCKEVYSDSRELLTHLRSHNQSIHSPDQSDPELDGKCLNKLQKSSNTILTDFIKVEPEYDSMEEEGLNQFESASGIFDNQIMLNEECSLEMDSETENTNKSSDLPTRSRRFYKCTHCDKQFTHRMYMVEYQRRLKAQKSYVCSVCEMAFITSLELQKHARNHEEGPQQCPICNIEFRKSDHLKIHMKSHAGENNFICDQCHKSFPIKSLLEKHIRSHSDDRSFQCGSCEQSFKDKYC